MKQKLISKSLMRIICLLLLTITMFLAVSACHKEKSAIELITGQYFDWDQREYIFVIDESLYHIVNIHDISYEDLETSTVISEEVHITDSDNKSYVEQGHLKNKLSYYLIRCEKLGLYLLVPHKEPKKLFGCAARPLGYCLKLLNEEIG